MIRRLYSSLTSFKELKFHPGLNLLLSDRSEASSDRQTRNRAGKSSFVEIVQFLLGASVDKESLFKSSALRGISFGMEFEAGGDLEVERQVDDPSKTFIHRSSFPYLPFEPQQDRQGRLYFSLERYRSLLGVMLFDLPVDGDGKPIDSAPSFRSLISYFARRQRSGAFDNPFRHVSWQTAGEQQVAIAYLLGLDWAPLAAWERLRRQEKAATSIRQAIRESGLPGGQHTSGELRSQIARLEARLEKARRSVSEFRLLPQYDVLEAEANELTSHIAAWADENATDLGLVGDLEAALSEEAPPDPQQVTRLFREAELVLPDSVRVRFEEVAAFHESVVRNRRLYLTQELSSARQRVDTRRSQIDVADSRRAELMAVLQSHGALDQFVQLQSEAGRVEGDVQAMRREYEAVELIENQRTRMEIERGQARLQLQQSLQEEELALKEALVTFGEAADSLYEDGGNLELTAGTNGLDLAIKMQGSASKGVSNMEIFCLDLTVARLMSGRSANPGFLIHDSHLYDGVDERQVAAALRLGRDWSKRFGFQYIVTMNTDSLPNADLLGFDPMEQTLAVRLTDDSDDGGLFGIRFD